jgi:hypothetical protein
MRKISCRMYYAADATANNRSRATCNKQRATDIAQKIATNKQRAECNRQQIAEDVQQTADDMQEDACSLLAHARCNGKHTELPHFVRGEQRAAHNQQHAEALYSTTSAQHGTDATHKTQHTTCAAACNKLT